LIPKRETDVPGGFVNRSLMGGELGLCREFVQAPRVTFGPCGSALIASELIGAYGFSQSTSERDLFVALGAGIVGRYRFVQSLWGRLEASLDVPLSRDKLTVAGEGIVYTFAPVLFLGKLGLEWSFGDP
jgi:hypothetical protein